MRGDPAEVIASDVLLQTAIGMEAPNSFKFGFKVQVFNWKMRSYRLSLGLTQNQLGKMVGISGHTIGQIETFRQFPSQSHAEKISEALLTSPEELFPNWLVFYVSDRSNHVIVSTSMEIQKVLVENSLGSFEPLLQPLIDPEPEPSDLVEATEKTAAVLLALDVLTPRERAVIELRFGLSENYSHTLDQVADKLVITRERARQIEQNALEKLRRSYGSLREYVPTKVDENTTFLPTEMDKKTQAAIRLAGIWFVKTTSSEPRKKVFLPVGWRVYGYKLKFVWDEKERPRFQIFDDPPSLEVLPRFQIQIVENKEDNTVSCDIFDCGKLRLSTDPVSCDDLNCQSKVRAEAEEWLGYRFPAWRNPGAYWD